MGLQNIGENRHLSHELRADRFAALATWGGTKHKNDMNGVTAHAATSPGGSPGLKAEPSATAGDRFGHFAIGFVDHLARVADRAVGHFLDRVVGRGQRRRDAVELANKGDPAGQRRRRASFSTPQ